VLQKLDHCSLSELDLLDSFPSKALMAAFLETYIEVPSKGDLAVAEVLTVEASVNTLRNLARAVPDLQVRRSASAHPQPVETLLSRNRHRAQQQSRHRSVNVIQKLSCRY
jgi:hypothetical protein